MQHVKLARERRRRKSRIKAVVFFFAVLSIAIGLLLSLKDRVDPSIPLNKPSDEKFVSLVADNSTQEANKSDKSAVETGDELKTASNADEATSYDDELFGVDDEIEQVDGTVQTFEALSPEAQQALDNLLNAANDAQRIVDQFGHTIAKGEKLQDVLELSGLDSSSANRLIEIDSKLNKLVAGQQIYWILDNQNELEYLNWLVSEKEERVYERNEQGKFELKVIEKKSIWKKEILKGEIAGSVNQSLQKIGLDKRQINQLVTALQWQFSLKKLKNGDKFAILISREYLGNELTGQGNVEGIHIINQGKSYYAIQAENGRYYNHQGETLGKGFSRVPLQRQAKISSQFNPARKHPVTGRIAPHKGVDFSMPIGTPIIAPADGVVEKIAYQAGGAGRYIMLRHGRQYQTVYMHLSKTLVKVGQTVKRGERIALSGNTGRSTGPHLHYEFHINGRPVNPMTVKLPGTSDGMPEAERRKFLTRSKSIQSQLRL